MRIRSTTSVAGIVLASAMLSGCLATPGTTTSLGFSPATMNVPPNLDDPALMALQSELTERHAQIEADPDAYFTGSAVCELNNEGQWLVNFTRTEADMDALHTFRERATGAKTVVQLGETKLIEGRCKDGLPDGPFVAVGAYEMTTSRTVPGQGLIESSFMNRTRMEGSATNGAMNGPVYFAFEMTFPIAPGQVMTSLFQSQGNFIDGRETGKHFVQMKQPSSMSTWVHEHRHASYGSHMQSRMYTGSKLMVEGQSLNGIPHGWNTAYTDANAGQRTCYVLGEVAAGDRCDLQLPPAGLVGSLAQAELNQLIRQDNQGKYLSPYTSDDVLAEWVNTVVIVNIGSTMGALAGAAAGGAIAAAADFVPYGLGSLLAAAVTAEMGKRVGREAAIAATGGWDNIRKSSDQSFDSADAMARYLMAKHGDSATYSEAVRVATDLYPDLRAALRRAY
ncbi:hypothetical protein [Marinobacter halophilus]|uniref:Lipoprotein n=1 Tax=Marinobacter halophilus TaxID=1323740 RepID=A0A2T1K972_9GAMM|nr:hypothetical protein [Marinobacter halophilus]PSF06701.1 hypothetical protein C7H08_16590 [Marinobacter halophilus]GGC74818.1 hypothetical protein GCM10011362_24240 [Marinobacter halophilus]